MKLNLTVEVKDLVGKCKLLRVRGKKRVLWETSPMTTIFLTSVSLFLQTDVTQQFAQRRRRWFLLRLPEECAAWGKSHLHTEMVTVLLYVCVCVWRQRRETERQEVHTRNRKWQVWKLWAPGAIRSFESEDLKGAAAASLLWLCSICRCVCFFDVDLTQLLESQTQSVRPDVDSCDAHNLTSSVTLNHSHRHRDGWHTSFLYDRWRQVFFIAGVNKYHVGKSLSSWGIFILLFQMFCN